MREIVWDEEKNRKLKVERGISYEEVAEFIRRDKVLDVYDHPNQAKYPGQKIYVLEIEDYVYLVPFVRRGEAIFLKTIIPSRKAKRKYV